MKIFCMKKEKICPMVQAIINFSEVGQPENQIGKTPLPVVEIQHNPNERLVGSIREYPHNMLLPSLSCNDKGLV